MDCQVCKLDTYLSKFNTYSLIVIKNGEKKYEYGVNRLKKIEINIEY